MSERPTVRPVTLARLVEIANVCEESEQTTEDVETTLGVSHRRARETILEATRIGLLRKRDGSEDEAKTYQMTHIGGEFLDSVRNQDWSGVSGIVSTHSPHYGAFLECVADIGPAKPSEVLETLQSEHEHTPYDFNQTTIEVVGDWAERLGAIQRNAFTGTYYQITRTDPPPNFAFVLLSVFSDLEDTAGVNLTQRYLPIPELREHTCEELECTRETFDRALVTLVKQNIGKLELSGAPVDTEAKEAKLGIKQIALAAEDGLVSTDHSTDQVMTGVEQLGKQYYYLAVHDDDISYTTESKQ